MTPTPLPQTMEGFEKEIEFLRTLIQDISGKLTRDTGLDQMLEMLDKVGRAAPQLARLVKAQHELASSELDPASLLRQALDELRQEWPEFRAFCEEFDPQIGKNQ